MDQMKAIRVFDRWARGMANTRCFAIDIITGGTIELTCCALRPVDT
jgi:hypothetical protein